jgi:antitoxin ParD1/3/4
MASMNISLPDPMRDYVQARIDSGQFATTSDYVRDLIRRDQNRVEEDQRWLRELDASIERSFEDLKSGRVTEATEVFDRLEAKYKRMAAARAEG